MSAKSTGQLAGGEMHRETQKLEYPWNKKSVLLHQGEEARAKKNKR